MEVNQFPKLIICPNCKAKQDKGTLGSKRMDAIALGSVTSEGYVIIKRTDKQMTMIMAESYSLICSCGFYIRVNSGTLQSSAQPFLLHEN